MRSVHFLFLSPFLGEWRQPFSRGGERKAEGSQEVRATPASADLTKNVQPYWLCKTPTPIGVGLFFLRAVEDARPYCVTMTLDWVVGRGLAPAVYVSRRDQGLALQRTMTLDSIRRGDS